MQLVRFRDLAPGPQEYAITEYLEGYIEIGTGYDLDRDAVRRLLLNEDVAWYTIHGDYIEPQYEGGVYYD